MPKKMVTEAAPSKRRDNDQPTRGRGCELRAIVKVARA